MADKDLSEYVRTGSDINFSTRKPDQKTAYELFKDRVKLLNSNAGEFNDWGDLAMQEYLRTGKLSGPVQDALSEHISNAYNPVGMTIAKGGSGIKDMGDIPKAVEALGLSPFEKGAVSAADVKRVNRRIGTTGQYVGAPPGIDSPQSLGALVNHYVDTMNSGKAGRNFYTDSSSDLFARSGHNANEADMFAQNLALLSRSNNVGGNTTMSVKGHLQAMTGEPVNTGRFPSKDSAPIQGIYDAGKVEYLGHKRDPFATQLGVEWAPERIGRGVNDLHEAEIMGYPTGKVTSATQHDFMDEVRARALVKANAQKLGGFDDWNTGNGQAAGWSGNKIRRGEVLPGDAAKSYADYLPLHEANATYEAVSSPATGHLQGLLDAPYDVRKAYTMAPSGSWNTSASGRDIGGTVAGLLPGETLPVVGRFKDSVSPAFVARPIVATETAADGSRVLTQGSKDAMNLIEASRAYMDGQEAGAWHKLLPAKHSADYTGATLNLGRPLSESDIKSIAPLFEKGKYDIGNSPNGLTIMANSNTPTGDEFAKQVRQIIKDNKTMFGSIKPTFGVKEGHYIDYGDQWKSGVPGSVTSKLLEYVDAAPTTAARLEGNSLYRSTAEARNLRDNAAVAAGHGVNKMELARQIFKEQGYEGLRRAAAAGTVPAAFLSVGDLPDWEAGK